LPRPGNPGSTSHAPSVTSATVAEPEGRRRRSDDRRNARRPESTGSGAADSGPGEPVPEVRRSSAILHDQRLHLFLEIEAGVAHPLVVNPHEHPLEALGDLLEVPESQVALVELTVEEDMVDDLPD
jgi:hypothetical protein